MRTRSASKRPPQIPPEKSEEVGKAKAGAKRKQEDRAESVKLKDETEEESRIICKGKQKANEESSKSEKETLNPKDGVEAINGYEETTINEMDWEEGDIPSLDALSHEITLEFTDSPSADKKPSRRASAKQKELSDLVHKVHLLCLLARGRLVDKICNDPLIQASMLSLLPSDLVKIKQVPNLTINDLKPFVNWFHSKFHLSTERVNNKGSFKLNLEFALQNQEGNSEELAALSVVLFRALNLTTRFVSILDISNAETQRLNPKAVSSPNIKKTENINKISPKNKKTKKENSSIESNSDELPKTEGLNCKIDIESTSSEFSKKEGPKRKSDIEFEMQLQMALSATETANKSLNLQSSPPNLQSSPPNLQISPQNLRQLKGRGESAIWSRNGPSLYWAEVYLSKEMLTGRWIHIDCINNIINQEEKVENDFNVCKRLLRYVVAFNGNGAKDVTRRYCMQWYKIAPKRVKQLWWERVLGPLNELESRKNGISEERNSMLEDIELENRALTEPLPTNQLAYKSHNQYAIEKWLNKNQIIYPKGPILGYCSGHPVYPRSCVHTLKTRHNWMKDGFQVKLNEIPAKKVNRPKKRINFEEPEKEIEFFEGENENDANIELFGKWQLEPLQIPHAINGIVPKNEHGNVEVWSEKCVPPGTVHLRLPRLVPVAKRLQIDFAPALIGFEFKNGKTYPVFEGLVICSEFKHALLEAYGEEEEKREIEEKKRDEKQALSKWYQLISSIVLRQRLNNSYAGPSSANSEILRGDFEKETAGVVSEFEKVGEHEHEFPIEKQSFDEDTCVRIKRCHCGFSIQVEEL